MTRRVLFAILAVLALLGAATVAAAERGDDDRERGPHDERREGKGERHDDENETDDDDRGERGRGHRGPSFERDGDRWLFHNDQVAVWFHQTGSGKASPDLKVFVNGTDGNQSGYRVKLLRIYEAEENSTDHHGRLNRINLAKAQDWNVETHVDNDSIDLIMVHAEAQGIVTLIWHLNTTTAAVKFDTRIDNWQWAEDSEGHRLVLDMLVVGHNLRNETGARVSVGDAGYISWATTAEATYGENDTRTIDVYATQKRSDDKDDEGDEGEQGTHLLLVFNGTAGYDTLVYDPTFGVQSSDVDARAPVPAAGLAGVAFAASLAVVALRRRD